MPLEKLGATSRPFLMWIRGRRGAGSLREIWRLVCEGMIVVVTSKVPSIPSLFSKMFEL